MLIVLLGPPGAGKGTQAILLCSQLGIPHISTGEIMRSAVTNNTPLGLKVKSYLDAGHLVPDDIVIQLVQERLGEPDCSKGCLLDGFPRTIDQAKALDVALGETRSNDLRVVEVKVPESVLLDRIRQRAVVTGGSRTDDTAEVASKRLGVYWAQTAPVSAYYRTSGRLAEIDGVGAVEEVSNRILTALGLGV